MDKVKEGVPEFDWGPYYPGGAVTGKVTDSDLAGNLSLIAHAGHPCGEDFLAAPFLAAHPEYGYLKPILKDMKSGPWTKFAAGREAARFKPLRATASVDARPLPSRGSSR